MGPSRSCDLESPFPSQLSQVCLFVRESETRESAPTIAAVFFYSSGHREAEEAEAEEAEEEGAASFHGCWLDMNRLNAEEEDEDDEEDEAEEEEED
jgi:hypothetical protein